LLSLTHEASSGAGREIVVSLRHNGPASLSATFDSDTSLTYNQMGVFQMIRSICLLNPLTAPRDHDANWKETLPNQIT